MENWFDTVFLPSLFERAGCQEGLWLTKKQTDICWRYMWEKCVGVNRYIVCEWRHRKVSVCVNARNGCGFIRFHMTKEEEDNMRVLCAENRAKYEYQRDKEHLYRMYRKNPKRFSERMERLKKQIADLKEDMDADILEGDFTEKDKTWYESQFAELEKKLALFKEVLREVEK